MSVLRLIHLSDIHFGQERDGELYIHEAVRDAVVQDTELLARQLGPADHVLVAGDIAYKGTSEEYGTAGQWLDRLTAAAGCDRTDVMLAPGNHDVDIDKIDTGLELIHSALHAADEPEATRLLGGLATSREKGNVLLAKMSAYRTFAAGYGCDFRAEDQPYCDKVLKLGDNRRFRFRLLNTVQASQLRLPKGALILGTAQYATLPRSPGEENIAVAHHPFSWLKDQQPARRFLSSRSRAIVVGHEHLAAISTVTGEDGRERLEIDSGAMNPQPGEGYSFTYNWLEIRTQDAEEHVDILFKVYPRVWSHGATEFVADRNRMQLDAAGGREFAVRSQTFSPTSESDVVPSNGQTSAEVSEEPEAGMSEDPNFATLRLFFWRHLDWRERLETLVSQQLLPETPVQPLPQTLEHAALQSARAQEKLEALWDAVMKYVPDNARLSNPYRAGES